VLILLPPSEGKFAPSRGKPLDLATLSFPELTSAREKVLDALVEVCHGDIEQARATLGLPPGLAGEVTRNAGLLTAPTTTVGQIYTGVLYDALGLDSLSSSGKRRASSRLAVTSSLFGLLRLGDRIPAYRLSGEVALPSIGTVASVWREAMGEVMRPLLAKQLVVDLRSGTYTAFWRPDPDQAERVVSLRVLHEANGERTVVSHFNKATKGRIVRALLEDGGDAGSARGFVALLTRLGWQVEPTSGKPAHYDVVVSEIVRL
jgi:cytoplasmic iron level regulating protein YaaA (DUF328/UPF0246 family)